MMSFWQNTQDGLGASSCHLRFAGLLSMEHKATHSLLHALIHPWFCKWVFGFCYNKFYQQNHTMRFFYPPIPIWAYLLTIYGKEEEEILDIIHKNWKNCTVSVVPSISAWVQPFGTVQIWGGDMSDFHPFTSWLYLHEYLSTSHFELGLLIWTYDIYIHYIFIVCFVAYEIFLNIWILYTGHVSTLWQYKQMNLRYMYIW